MKVRLLFVVPSGLATGSYQQIGLAARRLPLDEFEVHLGSLSLDGSLSAALPMDGLRWVRMPYRSFADIGFWRRYLATVAAGDFDIIHLFNGTEFPAIWAASLTCGVPLIVGHDHDGTTWDATYKRLIRRLARNSSIVAHWPSHDGIPVDHIMPPTFCPIDTPPEGRLASERKLRASFEIPSAARLIGVVGRLRPAAGLKDAIWVLDLLKVVRDDIHLLILGSGPQQWRLERFIRQTETADRVHLITDYPLEQFLPHLDVLWRTDLENVNPLVPLTAMSLGIPVVANDLSVHRELIVDGETGFLVPPGNRASLARATHALLVDEDLRRRVGVAAQASVRKPLSPEIMVTRLANIYRATAEPVTTKRKTTIPVGSQSSS